MKTTLQKVMVSKHVSRQVLADGPELMAVAFTCESSGEAALPNQPHIQSTYVESGAFVLNVNGTEFNPTANDSVAIPTNAIHACRCVKGGRLIDTFTPRRDDFL
ncbi:cupin [Amylibacter marinus]|uniref:Cupin n=1 Tax=Amylibacter marinus TaxID=1475483 RepID=A0ABQ5VRE8_9RHOB|nr:cupin [Amylibacter marinus]GLQ33987.1 cupin [Amylibacter marinus]